MIRGYLWQNLPLEVEAEFAQLHPLVQFCDLRATWGMKTGGWHIESDLGDMSGVRHSELGRRRGTKSTVSVQELRDRRRALGLCVDCDTARDPRSKTYCPQHREADRLRAAAKRKKMQEAKKLPDDREGTRLHFKILVREDQQDGTVTTREVDGYLTLNVMPDGESLREIFITVGKAGSSDAMYDAWAREVSNRLQEGAAVEYVFRPHVGTQFGDRGYLATPIGDVKQCTSVLDLVSRIVIERFGTQETA